jgi:hypothetical protein
MPVMYVPGVYPVVYSEFPLLPDKNSEQVTTSHDEDIDSQTNAVIGEATTASAESPCLQGKGMGLRHPRYSKRIQSKSEPSGSGTTSEEP